MNREIVGKDAEKDFIKLFVTILRLKNILVSFDEFETCELLLNRDFQDYQSKYIDLYQSYAEKEPINDDLVFEIELIKQVEVKIDYSLILVAKY